MMTLLEKLPSAGEWWQALRWVHLVFTLLIALALAGSFFPYEEVVAHGHPWVRQKSCAGCMFCGMTRGFCALSDGRFGEAVGWNRAAPLLYVGGWVWLGVSSALLVSSAKQTVRQREK